MLNLKKTYLALMPVFLISSTLPMWRRLTTTSHSRTLAPRVTNRTTARRAATLLVPRSRQLTRIVAQRQNTPVQNRRLNSLRSILQRPTPVRTRAFSSRSNNSWFNWANWKRKIFAGSALALGVGGATQRKRVFADSNEKDDQEFEFKVFKDVKDMKLYLFGAFLDNAILINMNNLRWYHNNNTSFECEYYTEDGKKIISEKGLLELLIRKHIAPAKAVEERTELIRYLTHKNVRVNPKALIDALKSLSYKEVMTYFENGGGDNLSVTELQKIKDRGIACSYHNKGTILVTPWGGWGTWYPNKVNATKLAKVIDKEIAKRKVDKKTKENDSNKTESQAQKSCSARCLK